MHLNRPGTKVKPTLFDHIYTFGCSVQRESIATDFELRQFVDSFLSSESERAWVGSVSASCSSVRSIAIDGEPSRAICVFDTAEADNPAHAELFSARDFDEADKAELRFELRERFYDGGLIVPTDFRAGAVLKLLPKGRQNASGKVPTLA